MTRKKRVYTISKSGRWSRTRGYHNAADTDGCLFVLISRIGSSSRYWAKTICVRPCFSDMPKFTVEKSDLKFVGAW